MIALEAIAAFNEAALETVVYVILNTNLRPGMPGNL